MNTARVAADEHATSVPAPTKPARSEHAQRSRDTEPASRPHRCRSCGQPLIDPPTGLIERWNWDDLAASTLARARRHRHSVALIMIDLDRFKTVNDENGHLAGDAVLRGVADVLRESARDGDLACRYGGTAGDEFLVLLPQTVLEDALAVAERIRTGITAMTVTAKVARGVSTTITGQTASIGVAAYCPSDLTELDLEDLLLDADVALRAAKRHGRDRICLANVDLAGGQSQAGRRLESWSRFRRLRSV